MKLKEIFNRPVSLALAAILVTQLAACGTLLYPERRGQRGGRIDPGIAVLDGIGVLFFVVPGLIAFAIDFTTGAIYMPHRRADLAPVGFEGVDVVTPDVDRLDEASVEAAVRRYTGLPVDLRAPGVQVYRLEGPGAVAEAERRIAAFSGAAALR